MGTIFGYSGFEDPNLIKSMSKLLKHRALDGYKYYKNKNITLGQGIFKVGKDFCPKPITNEDENIVLLCDGRIFRPAKIKQFLESKGHRFKTDFSGEIILHLYEEEGMDFLDKINGDFAFCLYDCDKKQLILCSDNSGSKPIYYYQKGKEIVFASDIKPILQYDLIKKKLDKYALDLFLTYLFLPTENTLFEGIKRVMPSTYVIFEGHSKRVVIYFEIKENIDYAKSEEYFVKKTRAELERAVEDRIIDRVPVHVSLGGLDSGSVTGILSSKTDNINTYSIAYDSENNELDSARRIAEMHSTNHHEIYLDSKKLDKFYMEILPYFNSPSAWGCCAMSCSNIFFKIKGKKSLFFNGDGGDPVFGCADFVEDMIVHKKLINLPYQIRNIISFLRKTSIKDTEFRNGLRRLIKLNSKSIATFKNITFSKKQQSLDKTYANLTPTFYFECYKSKNYLKNAHPNLLFIYNNYLQDKKYCFTNRLTKLRIELPSYMDKMVRNEILAITHGSINNCPFLDKHLINFSFQIPLKYKCKKNVNKIMLTKATKDLFPRGMNVKKIRITAHSKQFFRTYFNYNKSIIKDLFKKSDLYKYFNKEFLNKQITSLKSDEISGTQFCQVRIHTLFSLGLWYEHYFNNEKINKYFQ